MLVIVGTHHYDLFRWPFRAYYGTRSFDSWICMLARLGSLQPSPVRYLI